MLNNDFFFENRAVCEIMWKNVVQRGRPHMIIWRMSIACRIPKVTNTRTGRVILIALPTATVVVRVWTRLSVTLYLYCQSCYNWPCSSWTCYTCTKTCTRSAFSIYI